jgi:hypothetical protein
MASNDTDVTAFLKVRDLASLPKRRGRAVSTLYPRLVKAFASSGEKAMEVDVVRIGRKPETVRLGLAKAIKSAGLQDRVKVSRIGGEVLLLLR